MSFSLNGFGSSLHYADVNTQVLLSHWSWTSCICLHSFWFITEKFAQICSSLHAFYVPQSLPDFFYFLFFFFLSNCLCILHTQDFSQHRYLKFFPICSWVPFTLFLGGDYFAVLLPQIHSPSPNLKLLFFLRFYLLFMRNTEREAET